MAPGQGSEGRDVAIEDRGQPFAVDRLGHDLVHPAGLALLDLLLHPAGRQRDDRNPLVDALALSAQSGRLEAVHH
ncbi:MAG TPA: hypothetical protein VK505_03625, partial [Steroidobacteraceae bacterium]|nr:hypothetical protein [Steroidobacteraceae bacterium]